MSLGGVFVRDGERFVATELGRGPWDPGALHGGAPAALLAHVFEQLDPQPELELARVTYELVRPVPLGPLEVSARVTRPGRRVMLLEATISIGDGPEVVRARALRIRPSDVGQPRADPLPFAGPQDGRANDFDTGGQTMFATDALEIRFVQGAFRERGDATAWFRLRHPIVAGEEITPLQRVASAGDFGNGIANVLSWEEHLFINPDLTLYLERQPRGEWVGLQSQTRISCGGVGVAESTLWDLEGRIGRATQALLVARR
jgi:Thioesterase-like superfamily